VSDAVDPRAVLDHALSRPPSLGAGRLVCIDGLAGAGKTTLATGLAALAPVQLIHTDELLEGWGGLPGLGATIERLLRPLAAGEPSSWTRWDWHASRWAGDHPLSPGGLLVLEGVGSAPARVDDLVTTLVWVEAPRGERFRRGRARAGAGWRPQWERWLDDEADLHARERTRERADLLLRTSGPAGAPV
jgi:hypothetical protein